MACFDFLSRIFISLRGPHIKGVPFRLCVTLYCFIALTDHSYSANCANEFLPPSPPGPFAEYLVFSGLECSESRTFLHSASSKKAERNGGSFETKSGQLCARINANPLAAHDSGHGIPVEQAIHRRFYRRPSWITMNEPSLRFGDKLVSHKTGVIYRFGKIHEVFVWLAPALPCPQPLLTWNSGAVPSIFSRCTNCLQQQQ